MKRYRWGLFILFLILLSCVIIRLERKLLKDVRAWYDIHEELMRTYHPPDMSQRQDKPKDEKTIFLNLSAEKQKQYIKDIFWQCREIGMDDEFRLRMAVANRWFRTEGMDGWKTDRGRIMRICGQPDYEFEYLDGEWYMGGGEEWIDLTQHRLICVWKYWWGTGLATLIELEFYYDNNRRWRFIEPVDKQIQDFMAYWRWRMGPTGDGWKMIKEFIGE